MDAGDPACPVDQERHRERFDTAVELRNTVVADHNGVLDRHLFQEWPDGLPAIFIHRHAQYLEATIFIRFFELDEPGDLCLTRAAPRGPEIKQNNLSFVFGKFDGATAGVGKGKVGSGLAGPIGHFRGACRRRRAACE